jgi:hypothetical protein
MDEISSHFGLAMSALFVNSSDESNKELEDRRKRVKKMNITKSSKIAQHHNTRRNHDAPKTDNDDVLKPAIVSPHFQIATKPA